MPEVLDLLFHVFHVTIILINVTFWMSFRTLRIAQITLLLTLISWVGFGFIYGFGYCFLTDWHWQVKESLGDSDLPMSYIKLVVDRTLGINSDVKLIDQWTTIVLVLSIVGCSVQTIRNRKTKKMT